MSMAESLAALKAALDMEGVAYAYNVYPVDDGAPKFPYVAAVVTGGRGFHADDNNYIRIMSISLSLFTKDKQPAAEEAVMAALDGLELVYSWSENYIEDQKCYQIVYNFEMEA